MPEPIVLVFLQVKMKKNARTISFSIFIYKSEKKNTGTNSSGIFTCKTEKNKCQN
jgi:hypothetical protein